MTSDSKATDLQEKCITPKLEAIKLNFQNQVWDTVKIHCYGKLLLALDSRKFKIERLPRVITFNGKDQLVTVSKLEEATRPRHFEMPILTGILRIKCRFFVAIRLLQIQARLKVYVFF